MSLFDGILGQLTSNVDVGNLAEKIGLPADQVEQAIAALAEAHQAPGDTLTDAAAATGLDAGKLSEIVASIGGEGSLTRFNELISHNEGIMGALGGLLGKGGSGDLGGLADLAKGFFGKK